MRKYTPRVLHFSHGRSLILRPASYAGKHNQSRITLLMLLELLRQADVKWQAQGKYRSVREIADFGIEKLTYDYVRVRAPKLASWGFMSMKALHPETGRPVMGYRIEDKGTESVNGCPDDVFAQTLARIYTTLPYLDPTFRAQHRVVTAPQPEPAEEATDDEEEEDTVDNVNASDSPTDEEDTEEMTAAYWARQKQTPEPEKPAAPQPLYCVKVALEPGHPNTYMLCVPLDGPGQFWCKYPGQTTTYSCATLPPGAVLLDNSRDWNALEPKWEI